MENVISGFKYLLSVMMMGSGILTTIAPITQVDGALGFIYSTRISLVFFGIIFFICGLILLCGKIRKSKKWTGKGLLYIYLCFLFATLINMAAFGFFPVGHWIGNLIFAIITGLLWLRWKFKTEYVNPNHFHTDIQELTN